MPKTLAYIGQSPLGPPLQGSSAISVGRPKRSRRAMQRRNKLGLGIEFSALRTRKLQTENPAPGNLGTFAVDPALREVDLTPPGLHLMVLELNRQAHAPE